MHSFTRTVPLPGPGSYEISYSIYLNNAGGAGSECWLERDDSALALIQYYASDASASTSLRNGHSATDVITAVDTGPATKLMPNPHTTMIGSTTNHRLWSGIVSPSARNASATIAAPKVSTGPGPSRSVTLRRTATAT